tara:strand:- start:747 stop:863 length:117 start_codon:yes stop_codon:yes gene_type:complete
MKLQDWQKQILKMTEGEKLAPIFKPKDKKDERRSRKKP